MRCGHRFLDVGDRADRCRQPYHSGLSFTSRGQPGVENSEEKCQKYRICQAGLLIQQSRAPLGLPPLVLCGV